MAVVEPIFALALLFVLSCWYFLFRKKRPDLIEYITDPVTGRKTLRIFEGHFERKKHDKLYIFGEAQLSNMVVVESTVHLEKTHLVAALVALANKHPYLRMRCEWGDDCKRYLTEMDKLTVSELLYSEEESGNSINRFEQELQQVHDLDHGPLWSVVRIQDSFDSSTNKYLSTFLFSFHHAICDELSVLTLLDQLLEILDQLHLNKFDEENVPRLTILPPLLDLVKHHTHLSWWKKISMRLHAKLQSIKGLHNYFLDAFPPPLVHNPTLEPKTHIIPGSLTEQQTALLVKNCKANNCTVTGALAMCLITAVFKMAGEFGKNLTNVSLGIPVNVRKSCKPMVNDDDFGVFIGIVFLTIPNCENSFWDQATKVSCDIKQQVRDNKQYAISTSMENGLFCSAQFYEDSKINTKYAGRYPNFEITNCGNFSFDEERICTVKKLHFAVSEDVIGPTMSVSSVTVNGQLNWTVIYGNAAVNHEHARELSKLFNESLIEVGCSSSS